MRLVSGGRSLAMALCAAAGLLSCSSEPEIPDVVVETFTPVPVASPTPPPARGDVVRARAPGLLSGELTEATAEPGRCPNPYVDVEPASPREGALRIVPPVGVEPPSALSIEPPVPDSRLIERIQARLNEEDEPSRYAVVVKNLEDGRGVALNDERLFYAASLFKLDVMFEVFHQEAQNFLALEDLYIAADYYAGFGLSARLLAQCDEVTIEEALGAMMSVSDNVAAVMLQDIVGAGNINASMRALGLEHTVLESDGAIATTARDMALLIEAIAAGDAVNRDASERMATLLATEKIDDRIPSGVPEGTLVAHKTGNWENATHDVGIVYGERGTYVVVLMSDIGFDGDAGSVERDIMRIVWEHFEE